MARTGQQLLRTACDRLCVSDRGTHLVELRDEAIASSAEGSDEEGVRTQIDASKAARGVRRDLLELLEEREALGPARRRRPQGLRRRRGSVLRDRCDRRSASGERFDGIDIPADERHDRPRREDSTGRAVVRRFELLARRTERGLALAAEQCGAVELSACTLKPRDAVGRLRAGDKDERARCDDPHSENDGELPAARGGAPSDAASGRRAPFRECTSEVASPSSAIDTLET